MDCSIRWWYVQGHGWIKLKYCIRYSLQSLLLLIQLKVCRSFCSIATSVTHSTYKGIMRLQLISQYDVWKEWWSFSFYLILSICKFHIIFTIYNISIITIKVISKIHPKTVFPSSSFEMILSSKPILNTCRNTVKIRIINTQLVHLIKCFSYFVVLHLPYNHSINSVLDRSVHCWTFTCSALSTLKGILWLEFEPQYDVWYKGWSFCLHLEQF